MGNRENRVSYGWAGGSCWWKRLHNIPRKDIVLVGSEKVWGGEQKGLKVPRNRGGEKAEGIQFSCEAMLMRRMPSRKQQ